ncbi:hypothetical protein BDZ89DRAFT_1111243 [Hymenopellis radicata]|nr:hypothetical protein BDZ89DRAFT_1111243 [Hymenopellis radicata]
MQLEAFNISESCPNCRPRSFHFNAHSSPFHAQLGKCIAFDTPTLERRGILEYVRNIEPAVAACRDRVSRLTAVLADAHYRGYSRAMLATVFERSLPLVFDYSLSSSSRAQAINIVTSHSLRWHNVTLSSSPDFFIRQLGGVGPLPLLVTVALRITDWVGFRPKKCTLAQILHVFQSSPKLQSLKLDISSSLLEGLTPLPSAFPWHQLTHLEHSLRSSTFLLDCQLFLHCPDLQSYITHTTREEPGSSDVVPHSKLKFLDIEHVALLRYLQCASLTELKIDTGCIDYVDDEEVEGYTSSLRTFLANSPMLTSISEYGPQYPNRRLRMQPREQIFSIPPWLSELQPICDIPKIQNRPQRVRSGSDSRSVRRVLEAESLDPRSASDSTRVDSRVKRVEYSRGLRVLAHDPGYQRIARISPLKFTQSHSCLSSLSLSSSSAAVAKTAAAGPAQSRDPDPPPGMQPRWNQTPQRPPDNRQSGRGDDRRTLGGRGGSQTEYSRRVLVPPRPYSRSFSDPTRYRSADQTGRVAETPGRIEYPSIRVTRELVEVSTVRCHDDGMRSAQDQSRRWHSGEFMASLVDVGLLFHTAPYSTEDVLKVLDRGLPSDRKAPSSSRSCPFILTFTSPTIQSLTLDITGNHDDLVPLVASATPLLVPHMTYLECTSSRFLANTALLVQTLFAVIQSRWRVERAEVAKLQSVRLFFGYKYRAGGDEDSDELGRMIDSLRVFKEEGLDVVVFQEVLAQPTIPVKDFKLFSTCNLSSSHEALSYAPYLLGSQLSGVPVVLAVLAKETAEGAKTERALKSKTSRGRLSRRIGMISKSHTARCLNTETNGSSAQLRRDIDSQADRLRRRGRAIFGLLGSEPAPPLYTPDIADVLPHWKENKPRSSSDCALVSNSCPNCTPRSFLDSRSSPFHDHLGRCVAFDTPTPERRAILKSADDVMLDILSCREWVAHLTAALAGAHCQLASLEALRTAHIQLFPPIHMLPAEILFEIFQLAVDKRPWSSPLSFHYELDSRGHYLDIVKSHSQRWQNISIFAMPDDYTQLGEVEELPLLETASLVIYYPSRRESCTLAHILDRFRYAPKLQSLKLRVDLLSDDLNPMSSAFPWHQLTRLDVSLSEFGSLSLDYQLLVHCPNLLSYTTDCRREPQSSNAIIHSKLQTLDIKDVRLLRHLRCRSLTEHQEKASQVFWDKSVANQY